MSGGRDELELPFLFVGRDEPEPREWMEAHPGWLKIPAVMVPRGGGNGGPNEPGTGGAGQAGAFVSGRQEGRSDAAPFLQVSETGSRAAPNTKGLPPAAGAKPIPPDVQAAILGHIPAVDTAEKRLEDARVRAFLRLLRWEENGDVSDDVAYHARLGGHDPMTDEDMKNYHPKLEEIFRKQKDGKKKKGRKTVSIKGTAAGAYQITKDSWLRASKELGLKDFKKADQEEIVVHMIEGKQALGDIRRGDLDSAFGKLRGTWASLPGGSQSHRNKQEAIAKFNQFLREEQARP